MLVLLLKCLMLGRGHHMGGQMTHTPNPIGSMYAGVVSHESVCIDFMYPTLNRLNVCVADIRNVYLQAPSSQKNYIIWGPEFRIENGGKLH